ncbi:hypothetical protein EDB80DRAFT_691062 [Ilyonectria destructans]|nr:hypothetical protein EDB80DRAFT_691062 [Ilyonectria destructans]
MVAAGLSKRASFIILASTSTTGAEHRRGLQKDPGSNERFHKDNIEKAGPIKPAQSGRPDVDLHRQRGPSSPRYIFLGDGRIKRPSASCNQSEEHQDQEFPSSPLGLM